MPRIAASILPYRRTFASSECATILVSVRKNVIIVGGGLAGLAASLYLARAGHTVTIFEKRRYLGGRAITHLRHGFRFNLGPHAICRTGLTSQICRELGVPLRGGKLRAKARALAGGSSHRLPWTAGALLMTGALSAKAKLEAARLVWRLWRLDPAQHRAITAREWLDANVRDQALRQIVEALMRYATYSDHADQQSAAVALRQLKLTLRGSIYLDEGWQRLVDAMHSHAIGVGVNFVTSSRIVGVSHRDGAITGVELGGLEIEDRNDTQSVALPEMPADGEQGTRLKADTVLLAVDPATARELVGGAMPIPAMQAVTATCLDVALSSLPSPAMKLAIGIDRPYLLAVHSAYAQLTPRGGALIHVAKYRKQRAAIDDDELEFDQPRRGDEVAADEQELEALLDQLQPGWRDVLVHRRFLPSMTVSHSLVTPGMQRPPVVTQVRGLYLAGDWVGDEGILADAALSSARTAARAIIGAAD
jgi:phytoene dehydrogenase-like protein